MCLTEVIYAEPAIVNWDLLNHQIERMRGTYTLEDVIRTNPVMVNWNLLIKQIDQLDNEFIIEHIHRFNWEHAPWHYNFTEEFVRECQDHLDWNDISFRSSELSDDFIREFADSLDWDTMAFHGPLSEEMIRGNQTRFDSWNGISMLKLSLEFIREFADRLNWNYLLAENHSPEILIEHFDRINHWEEICGYSIPSDTIDMIMQKDESVLVWARLCQYSDLSEEIITKYLLYMDWKIYSQQNYYAIPKIVYEYQHLCNWQSARVQQLLEIHQTYLEQVKAMTNALGSIIPTEILAVVAAYM